MSFMERISKVDSRVIFTLVWVLMVITLIFPVGLPLVPSANSVKVFEWCNENIKPGDTILLSFDYDFGNMAENYTGMLAVMRIALEHDAKVLTTSMWSSGGLVAERCIDELAREFPNKTKGVDYLHLGYKPGSATFISSMMDDISVACAHVDAFNVPLSDYPIMANVKNLYDVKMVCTGGSGSPGAHEWVQQYAVPSGKPYIGCIESVSIPSHATNLQSGVMTAMIPGMRGSAEMEQLSDHRSMSSQGMDAQAFVHLLVFVLMALGNVNYFMTRKAAK